MILYPLIFLYGFTVSSMGFACLSAIPLMPIGDLIVISFTSPVFSVFLDRIVLKRPLTRLGISLCFLVVVGDVFVVQPQFLFGDKDSTEEEGEKHGKFYFLGVALCVYAALAGAIANVAIAQCNKMTVSTNQLMLVSGTFSVALSLVATSLIDNRLIFYPQTLPLKAALLLPFSALVTMVAFWTITLAVSLTRHPTLISMLRSTEILISLVTESIWWNHLPGLLSLFGSLLVAICVFSMAAHDKLNSGLSNLFRFCRKTEKADREVTRL